MRSALDLLLVGGATELSKTLQSRLHLARVERVADASELGPVRLAVVFLSGASVDDMAGLPRLAQTCAVVVTVGRPPSAWPFGWGPTEHHPHESAVPELARWIEAVALRYEAEAARLTLRREFEDYISSDPLPTVVMDDEGGVVLANDAARACLDAELRRGTRPPHDLILGPDTLELESGRSFKVHRRPLEMGGTRRTLVQLRSRADSRTDDLEQQLLHSERLVAVGQLAAGVAHEVNNPAAFVTANLCMLGEHINQVSDVFAEMEQLHGLSFTAVGSGHGIHSILADAKDIVRENLEGMGRISSILRDLKNFSRIEQESVETVHVNEIVNASCNLVHNQIRHRAQLIKELGDVPTINADRNKLTQVLMNLLMNAAQAIPEGKTDAIVKIRSRVVGDRIELDVVDSGVGIPDDVQKKIFEPFYTTKSRDKGTGLGLALCADIVRQHGGSIEVASELGRGSRFTVSVPRDTGLIPGEHIVPVELTATVDSGRTGRILVVDDEMMLLKAYKRSLGRRHDVVLAHGGEEALAILAEDDAFDVIICDLMMPGIDGIRVFHSTVERTPGLRSRFIFCSGGAFTPRTREFCGQIDLPVHEKPLTPADIESAIQDVMNRCAPDPLPPMTDEDPDNITRSFFD